MQRRDCVLHSICTGSHRSCSQGPGEVGLREPSLRLTAREIGEVMIPSLDKADLSYLMSERHWRVRSSLGGRTWLCWVLRDGCLDSPGEKKIRD
jgi:hypothetical protein